MKISKSGTIGILLVTVIFSLVFANLLSVRHFLRLDLTKDGKYTLSQGSKETMKTLGDAMVVTAYFTEGLPSPYSSYSRYVRDLLEEYRAASNNKLAFEFIDPVKEENDEDKQKKKESQQDIFGRVVREPTAIESDLMSLGITPIEIRVIEDDQQQTKRAYMGLVVRYQGKKEVLPVVQDFTNFEKDLTVIMRKLVRQKTPVVGLLSDVPGANTTKLKSLVRQTVELRELNAEDLKEIPTDVDAILVLGSGNNLKEDALKAVDAFVVSGKNAAFFVDQYEVDLQSLKTGPKGESKAGTKLTDLLITYGFAIGKELVADIQCASLNVQEQRGSMVFGVPVEYPYMPQVPGLNQESPIAHGLASAIFPFSSPINISKAPGLVTRIIAESSKKSWLEVGPFNTDPQREWRSEDIQLNGPYALVVEGRGAIKSHFHKNATASSNKESRILVAGTSAFAWDQFLSEENQALAMASVDYLVADEVVLSMRGRSVIDLPLDPDLSDDKRSSIKLANMLGVPALLIAYGFYRWRRRERRRRFITIDSI